MADDLTIAGIPVRVEGGTWDEGADIVQGERLRMAEGNVLDMTYAPARAATCRAWFLTVSEETTLRAACPVGVPVAIAGDLTLARGGAFQGVVDFSRAGSKRRDQPGVGSILVRVVTLQIEESLSP